MAGHFSPQIRVGIFHLDDQLTDMTRAERETYLVEQVWYLCIQHKDWDFDGHLDDISPLVSSVERRRCLTMERRKGMENIVVIVFGSQLKSTDGESRNLLCLNVARREGGLNKESKDISIHLLSLSTHSVDSRHQVYRYTPRSTTIKHLHKNSSRQSIPTTCQSQSVYASPAMVTGTTPYFTS